jgi:hypothetical protein
VGLGWPVPCNQNQNQTSPTSCRPPAQGPYGLFQDICGKIQLTQPGTGTALVVSIVRASCGWGLVTSSIEQRRNRRISPHSLQPPAAS